MKLASQRPDYLPRRLSYAARKRFVDRVFPSFGMASRADFVWLGPEIESPLRDYCRTRRSPIWHWGEADVSGVVNSIPQHRRDRCILDADDILQRRFTFRGREPISLALGDWHPDGVSSSWTLDLNRHHWFATLGFAYWYTQDVRYLRAFVRESSDWMDQHLALLGRLSWDTPFEVASRINAWLWAFFLFLPSPDWDANSSRRLLGGLGLLAEYLHQTIEYHSPGNHVLLEAKALALCSETFPEFRGAPRWRRKAWRMLKREIALQVGPDGVHVERSTMYHRIIAGELAELWLFCVHNDFSEQGLLASATRRMAEVQGWMTQGDGSLPLFADAYAADTYFRFNAPAVAAAEKGYGFKDLINEATDHSFWLIGRRPMRQPSPRHCPVTPAARAFPEGGYFVVRSDWTAKASTLVWDCGPTGYKMNRKHAHLDALSFTLSIDGVPLLIDPGTNESNDQKEPLRSTTAHSTVCVDHQEQGVLASRGEIWSPPRADLLLFATSEDCVVMAGRHDGYRRLPSPVWHTRTIVTMHGLYWLIVDELVGTGVHVAEQRFHVAPESLLEECPASGSVTMTKGGVALVLSWAQEGSSVDDSSKQPRVRIEPSVAEMVCGRPEQSSTIVAQRDGPVPFGIAVAASTDKRRARVRWSAGHDGLGSLIVTGDCFSHEVYLRRDCGTRLVLPDGTRIDANVAIFRSNVDAPPHDVLYVNHAGLPTAKQGVLAGDATLRRISELRRVELGATGKTTP